MFGTYKCQSSDAVKFDTQLISAEIKTNSTQSVVAFGQACAYRLFSHKTYIVMPTNISKLRDDLERLEALCVLCGIGRVVIILILENPDFERKIPPPNSLSPDIFYVNEFAGRLRSWDKTVFNDLF